MNIFGIGFAAIFFVVALFFLVTLLLQYLWNTTMPDVFSLKEISFWQAFRLLLISAILFGGAFTSINM